MEGGTLIDQKRMMQEIARKGGRSPLRADIDYRKVRNIPLDIRVKAEIAAEKIGEKPWNSPYGLAVTGLWFRGNFTFDYTKTWDRTKAGEIFLSP